MNVQMYEWMKYDIKWYKKIVNGGAMVEFDNRLQAVNGVPSKPFGKSRKAPRLVVSVT